MNANNLTDGMSQQERTTFKIGDRVQIVATGVVGTVTFVSNSLSDRVNVHCDNGIVASLKHGYIDLTAEVA